MAQGRKWINRRGRPLTSQAIGMLLRNQLYAGIVDVPEYGVRGKHGDFEPLNSEDLAIAPSRLCRYGAGSFAWLTEPKDGLPTVALGKGRIGPPTRFALQWATFAGQKSEGWWT